ncbi:MAG: exodeoxyribonuclease VII small subunit [Syntrophales bacterium]|nr:exodeoxyribonuclease VII small subunit [Syntrophales bacterium]MDD5233383.1 exodeoxyribonuclease VII small subunit [Syntrophales bacterium]MDD5533359.1 exodeoxyribonuclease VII small subunit [Syntrophales bacterium]HPL64255.1 exodeoxyribonuclease VII small subunit [Syntrophales bacterium]
MAKETFEQALAKMEEIVRKMEAGDLTLEESLKAFEEGVRLSGICTKRLEEAERKVEILLKEGRGLTARPFESEEKENG